MSDNQFIVFNLINLIRYIQNTFIMCCNDDHFPFMCRFFESFHDKIKIFRI